MFVDFDLEFQENVMGTAKFKSTLTNEIQSFAIGLWVRCMTCTNVLTISDSDNTILSISEEESLIISAMGLVHIAYNCIMFILIIVSSEVVKM